MNEWISTYGVDKDQTILFVGHGVSQDSLLEYFLEGEEPPNQHGGHAAVLDLEVTGIGNEMKIRGLRFHPGLMKPPEET